LIDAGILEVPIRTPTRGVRIKEQEMVRDPAMPTRAHSAN